MPDNIAGWFRQLDQDTLKALVRSLGPHERNNLRYFWDLWARSAQLPPAGAWRIWLVCAGRGFGKTRAGSEWVRGIAAHNPAAHIALIGASLTEARSIMVEGESGVLAVSPPDHAPKYEASLRRLKWPNGAQATLYSAAEPESLRGPQHSHAWCDEIAKWDASKALSAWDNLMMGLRLGNDARIMATTTPRAVPLMQRLLKEETGGNVSVTRGSTYDNAVNLPEHFITDMRHSYGGSSLGRQELDGEMLTEIEGALWSRTMLEQCRVDMPAAPAMRIVIAIDPPVSADGDECGIIVAALCEDGSGVVLADCTLSKASPERWARAAADAAEAWSADRIVAEANQGGAMVASVLRAANVNLPIKLVHASRGKVARAEPIAALYEAGRIHHAGQFPALEDQLCGLLVGGTYEGPGRSPDRADALVWALTELMLGKPARPRISPI